MATERDVITERLRTSAGIDSLARRAPERAARARLRLIEIGKRFAAASMSADEALTEMHRLLEA